MDAPIRPQASSYAILSGGNRPGRRGPNDRCPAQAPAFPYSQDMTAVANTDPLAKAIADIALLRGNFTLRSGKTSTYYLDKYLFSTRPELLKQLVARRSGRGSEKAQRLSHA